MSKYKFDWSKTKEKIKENKETKRDYSDPRFWKLKLDDDKKGSAIIRFLPDKNGTPYVQLFSHWFHYEAGSGEKIYAENCATSIKGDCPICTKNRELWNSAFEVDKNVARQRKRKKDHIANIYVIKDPANPENEGKVFLYNFGSQVFNIYDEAMYGPSTEVDDLLDDDNINTFVPCAFFHTEGDDQCGADFVLKATKKKNSDWVTYEYSKFKTQSEFLDGDEKAIDKVMEKTFLLDEWTKEDAYPKPETVYNRLASILGARKVSSPVVESVEEIQDTQVVEELSEEEMSDDDYINSLI